MEIDKINVLLVDDEEVLLDAIKRRLQIREFNVIAVNRGEKALEAVREHPVDVVILDLKMPGLSGKDVLLSLKKDYPWLEIVILTGHGSFDPHKESAYGKAYTYLAKPCDLATLLQVLTDAYQKTVMNRHQINQQTMKQLLDKTVFKSPRDILRRLKMLDKEKASEPTE